MFCHSPGDVAGGIITRDSVAAFERLPMKRFKGLGYQPNHYRTQ
jgi:hypothetical protein